MKMNRYTQQYAYSFEEFLRATTTVEDFYFNKINVFGTDFKTLSKKYFNLLDSTYWQSGNGAKLWQTLFNKHFNEIIILSENVLASNEFIDHAKDFLVKFYSIWERTHDKYDKLIELYNSQENNLLAKLTTTTTKTGSEEDTKGISTTTETRTNDTPQNDSGQVAVEDLDHESLYQKNTITPSSGKDTHTYNNVVDTTENDPATIIERLDEIKRLYDNLFDKWTIDFDGLFISHLNYVEVEEE